MSAILERRYARLLRLYPGAYRRGRESELLSTLLEGAEPGTVRPTARETRALIVGALRAHAGTDVRWSVRQSWLSALRTAVVMLLVQAAAYPAVDGLLPLLREVVAEPASLGHVDGRTLGHLAALAVQATAVLAVLRGRYRSAILLAVGAFALLALSGGALHLDPSGGRLWHLPLAVLLMLPLLRRHAAPPLPSLLLVLGLPVLPVSAEFAYGHSIVIQLGLLAATCLAVLAWGTVDQRLPLAFGLLLATNIFDQAAFSLRWQGAGPVRIATDIALAAVVPGVLLATGALVTRRQARL